MNIGSITSRFIKNSARCNLTYKYVGSNLLQQCHLQQRLSSSSGSHTGGPRGPTQEYGLGRAKPRQVKQNRDRQSRQNRMHQKPLSDTLNLDQTKWTDIYVAAESYNPSVIPLPIRMGRPMHNRLGDVPPSDAGNVELLKIPNFFHLTPPAIKQHCEALKEYCTPWPDDIGSRPIRITTINYVYAGPSIRHPDSRKVKLQVYLKALELDDHARQKLILLTGDRYNPKNDELTLIADICPTRKQNKEYTYYLLTALYHESWKTEPWEEEAIGKTDEELKLEIEQVQRELEPDCYKEKQRMRRHYRVINGKVIRYNRRGHPFVFEMRKYGINGELTQDELNLAKEEWEQIQTDQPDNSTFDRLFHRNSESEWKT